MRNFQSILTLIGALVFVILSVTHHGSEGITYAGLAIIMAGVGNLEGRKK